MSLSRSSQERGSRTPNLLDDVCVTSGVKGRVNTILYLTCLCFLISTSPGPLSSVVSTDSLRFVLGAVRRTRVSLVLCPARYGFSSEVSKPSLRRTGPRSPTTVYK